MPFTETLFSFIACVLCWRLLSHAEVDAGIIESPIDTLAIKGSDAQLNCTVDITSNTVEVQWYVNTLDIANIITFGEVSLNSSLYKVEGNHTQGEYHLYFPKVILSLASLYYCRALFDVTQPVELSVIDDGPVCSVFPGYTIIAHKTAVFNCTAIVGIPPGQSVWTINGKVVSNSDTAVHTLTKSFGRYDQGAILNCGIIHQTVPQPEETGLTCEQPITMNIQFPPIVNTTYETATTVLEGEDYFATCGVQERGNPDVVDQWYWYFPNSTKYDNGKLYLIDVTREANGTYTCVAENTYYDGSTGYGNATVDFNVHYVPLAVISDVSPCTVIEGQTYTAYCEADANPAAELYWTDPKDDRIAIGDILEIIDTKREDVGNYTCHATNVLFTGRAGYANATVHLDVQYPPTLEVESEYVCKEEESVILLCDLKDANPLKVDFVWLLENGSMVSSASVTLTEVSRVDAGQYVCNGYNIYYDGEHGHGSVTTILDVQYRPEVFTQTMLIRVAEGAPVTLDCTTDSNPPTDSHDWTLNGDVISYELIHTIDRADRSDAGLYNCTAVNTFYDGEKGMGYNTTQLVVEYPATVAVTNNTIGPFLEGDEVFAVCEITEDGNPETLNAWYWLEPDGEHSDGGVLNLGSVSRRENGTYTCVAENKYYDNSIGRGIALYDVLVHYKPSIREEDREMINVTKGSSVSLFCSADASPNAEITWKKEGETLDLVRDSETYIITSVVEDDEGTYTCTAENYLGDDQREIKLNVLLSSGYAVVVPTVSTLGFMMVLHCKLF